jgi:hypothetical protein
MGRFYTRLGASVGDKGVMAEIPRRATTLGRRTYGGDAADRPPVRCAYGGVPSRTRRA